MSTTPSSNPSQAAVQPAAGWYPNLDGSGLPRAAVNGINQIYTLLYSLRDTLSQHQATTSRMLQYGTGRDRMNVKASTLADGSLWVETDSTPPGKVYQVRYKPTTNDLEWVAVN